ncbi:MAG: type II secretion system protein GspG [Acidobacteriota bacterium]|nr:type II secretion system protein GspG [Acidobacteriota bacterium]
MNRKARLMTIMSSAAGLLLLWCGGAQLSIVHGQKVKAPSMKDARRAITRIAGFELSNDAVRVETVTPLGTMAEVAARITTAFRAREQEGGDGGWRVEAFRAADQRWEEIDFYTSAIGTAITPARATLDALVTDLAVQQLTDKKLGELRRGSLRAEKFSPLLSSAVVSIEVEAGFRLEPAGEGKWRVAEVRFGGSGDDDRWLSVVALVAAADAAKLIRAREELQSVRAALEAYRRERGSYVVADDHATLIDHLSPHYLPRVVRLDPWHRPYRYDGTRDRYVLRSDGADGRTDTADDVALDNRNT